MSSVSECLESRVIRKRPSGRLAALTRKGNEIQELMKTESQDGALLVKRKLKELHVCLDSFVSACEVCEEDVETEDERQKLTEWRQEIEEESYSLGHAAKLWYQRILGEKSPEIPRSSVSVEKSTVSSSSLESLSESLKLEAMAKRAEMETEKQFIAEKFKLLEEEIQIEKRKEELRVEKELARANAQLQIVDDRCSNNFQSCHSRRVSEPKQAGQLEICNQVTPSTEALLKQQERLLLPRRELKSFDRDYMEYQLFANAFDFVVGDKVQDDRDRLYFLEQYTKGEPQDLVRSCLHLDPKIGYKKARELLNENYGDKFLIASSYSEKLLNWPIVKSEDGQELGRLGLYLTTCFSLMNGISYMSSLDHVDTLQKIVAKLPFELRKKWRNKCVEIKENSERLASLKDLAVFVNREAKILKEPIFGKIVDHHFNAKEKTKPRFEKFATKKSFAVSTPITMKSSCLLCSGAHCLDSCERFVQSSYDERINVMKKFRICFGCLKQGHTSKECRSRHSCGVCGMKHPTILHRYNRDSRDHSGNHAGPSSKINNMCTEVGCKDQLGAGSVYVAIVPVKVRVKGSDKTIVTYAAQDPYSTAAFVTENLVNKLGIKGKSSEITLTTLEKTCSSMKTTEITNLEVLDLDENTVIRIPVAYSKRGLPITTEDLICKKKLQLWNHLKDVLSLSS